MRERVYSTHEVATMIGTNASSVVRWIDTRKLKAYKTPGGHRRIRERDLRSFLSAYDMPVPADLVAEGARRMLICDADGRSCAALARALRRALPRAEVATSADPMHALLQVGMAPPDALIVDGGVADPSALARALRAFPETAEVALIVLMARADSDTERKLRAAGVRAVLERPTRADRIVEALGGKETGTAR